MDLPAFNRRNFIQKISLATTTGPLGLETLANTDQIPRMMNVVTRKACNECVTWGEGLLGEQIRDKFSRSFMGCSRTMFADDWRKAQKALPVGGWIRIFTVDNKMFRQFKSLKSSEARDSLLKEWFMREEESSASKEIQNPSEKEALRQSKTDKKRDELLKQLFNRGLMT